MLLTQTDGASPIPTVVCPINNNLLMLSETNEKK